MFLALLAFPLLAQVNEVIEVRVTEVEVVVVDSHGKPVSGLTKDDFELREGGKAREITNFYAVNRALSNGGQAILPVPATTPEGQTGLSVLHNPPTHLAFFVDNVHLDLRQRNRVLDAVKRFAEANVKEGVTASLLTYEHDAARVRVPFTADKSKIVAAVDAMEHESARALEMVSERRSLMRRIDAAAADKRGEEPDKIWRAVLAYSDDQAHELEKSLAAVSDAVRRLSGVPGRKVLVHVSSGLPLQPGIELMDYFRQAFQADPAMVNMQGLQVEKSRSFERMIKDAQSNGVIVDTIDAGGIAGFVASGVEEAGGMASLNATLTRDNSRQTLQLIADETGGRAIINENDFDRALLDIAADTTTYYSLGFRSGDGETGGLKKVDVRVKRPGLTVRATKAVRDRTFEERLLDSVQSAFDFPLDINPLGAVLDVGEPTGDADAVAVPVRLTVDPSRLVALPGDHGNVAHVRCYYEVRDSNGGTSNPRIVDQDLTIDDTSHPLQITRVAGLRLRRGRYILSLAVRDLTTNETAYVQRPLVVGH